jgi:polyisoprenoid-binding protein YceI
MRLTALVLAAVLIAGPIAAAKPVAKKAEPTATPAPVPVWKIDKAASRVGFTGATNGQAFKGGFRKWDAFIRFDPKRLDDSRVNVLIDTASAFTGDPSRDQALPTADWLAVSTFPRAIFSADTFKALGGGRYQAIGTLAIRNVRRPVVLPFTLAMKDDKAVMHGVLTIDRTTFGVGQGQFATGDTVATAVKIEVSVSATRAK